MPAPVVIAGTGVALFNGVRAGMLIYDIHRRKNIRRKEDARLERAKLEETMAYQRVKDSRAALVASVDRLMGDVTEQSDYFRGYYWNPYSLRYDIAE
jgi:predicted Holliday junction resolvase-like endonuclease